ncbi:type VII secretion-associated serine protease mycosin [Streptomyces sp. NPDC056149]|uniref:type VII secretion-associated serine protease mycosin n=1 Tax=Streptomyces sp. NPDC056149 TaxID=3345728 RepID=UPI0035D90942
MTIGRWLRTVACSALLAALCAGAIVPSSAADSIRDRQWPLSAYDVDSVWKVSTGRGVTVAVIDTGADGTHPDLVGNVLSGKNFLEGGTADHVTTDDHGTSMAGLIAGHGHGADGAAGVKGLAPESKVLPLRVTADNASSVVTRGMPVADAVRYAVDHGASVVNMSLGGTEEVPGLKAAIRYAQQKDAVVVAGTGNDGTNSLAYPASIPGVIAVGAVDSSGKVWPKSNYGSGVLLTAPGVGTVSTSVRHMYSTGDGTSVATAYVSAAAALLRSKFPDLSAGQIANRLVKTAKLPDAAQGAKVPDQHYGYGFIRPYSALTEDIPAGSKNGPLPAPSPPAASHAPTASDDATKASSKAGSSLVPLTIVGCLVVVGIAVGGLVLWRRRRQTVVSPAPSASPYASGAPTTPDAYPYTSFPDDQHGGGQQPDRGFRP